MTSTDRRNNLERTWKAILFKTFLCVIFVPVLVLGLMGVANIKEWIDAPPPFKLTEWNKGYVVLSRGNVDYTLESDYTHILLSPNLIGKPLPQHYVGKTETLTLSAELEDNGLYIAAHFTNSYNIEHAPRGFIRSSLLRSNRRNNMKTLILSALIALTLNAETPQPLGFDISTVRIAATGLVTPWVFAEGKWSDGGPKLEVNSTEIHCYQRLGFCSVATAFVGFDKASVMLNDFDILRWDEHEIIAVDSSPTCAVNTIRFDLDKKTVTISGTMKAPPTNAFSRRLCKATKADITSTAFLTGKEVFTERP